MCHDGKAFANSKQLKDVDSSTGTTIAQCEAKCASTDNCVAIMVTDMIHTSGNHCHTFSGSLSESEFDADLSVDTTYDSCFLTPMPKPKI